MKILQLTPYFLPYTGGIEKYVYNLSKFLVKRGHEVEIITSNFPKTKKFEIMDDIVIKRYACIVRPLRNAIVLSFLALDEEIKKFDVVNVHNIYSFTAFSATFHKKKYDTPLVLTHHGQHQFGEYIKDLFVKVYRKSIEKFILNSVNHVVVLSSSDVEYISSFGVNRNEISVIPNAVNPDEFKPYLDLEISEFLKKHNLDKKDRILFVGQVIARKGVEYLIRAIPIMLKEISKRDFVFIIVGSGDFLDKAKKLVKSLDVEKFVVFTGIIPFNELVQAYKSANIFVLPSLSEGMPTSILEAMYFGLPVVATDIPGVKDHFKDVALLVPPKNESELAEAIVKLLEDKELILKLSKAGEELVKSRYTWDVVAKDYEKIYKELILLKRGAK